VLKKLPLKFWFFATSQLISNLADGMVIIIITLLTSRITNSPSIMGIVIAALGLPWFLFSLFAGPIIDQKGAYHVIKHANLARGMIFGIFIVLVVLNLFNIYVLVLFAFLLGVFEMLSDNSYSVMLPEIINSEFLEQANSVTSTAEIVTNKFFGINLGAFLLGISTIIALTINSVLFLLSVLFLVLTFRWNAKKKSFLQKVDEEQVKIIERKFNPNKGLKQYINDILFGLSYIMKQKKLILLVLMGFAWNYSLGVQRSFMVLYLKNQLNFTEQFFSLTLSIAGLGGIIGGLTVGFLIMKAGRFKVLALGLILCVSQYFLRYTMVSGVTIIVAALFEGCADIYYNTIAVSYRQRVIPKEYLGRITTTLRFILIGSISLGSITGGFVAEVVNYQILGTILGAVIASVGIISLTLMKDIEEPKSVELCTDN